MGGHRHPEHGGGAGALAAALGARARAHRAFPPLPHAQRRPGRCWRMRSTRSTTRTPAGSASRSCTGGALAAWWGLGCQPGAGGDRLRRACAAPGGRRLARGGPLPACWAAPGARSRACPGAQERVQHGAAQARRPPVQRRDRHAVAAPQGGQRARGGGAGRDVPARAQGALGRAREEHSDDPRHPHGAAPPCCSACCRRWRAEAAGRLAGRSACWLALAAEPPDAALLRCCPSHAAPGCQPPPCSALCRC